MNSYECNVSSQNQKSKPKRKEASKRKTNKRKTAESDEKSKMSPNLSNSSILNIKSKCADENQCLHNNQNETLACCENGFTKIGEVINKVSQNDDGHVDSDDTLKNLRDQNDDWEKLFDEGLMGLHENGLGNLNKIISSVSLNSENQLESDGSSVIEIFGFPEEFKTQDLLKAFTSFINRGFKLRWVDDTHALGIFPSSSLADEALTSNLPFVKTRPLSQATEASKIKAKSIVLPSSLRPKTCTGLARRLVSSALGIKYIVSPAERQAELKVLREAKEQRRLAAEQREAAWEGRF